MKTILFAIFFQFVPGPNGEPTAQVMASTSAEFDSRESCQNAAGGLAQLGQVSGFKTNVICAPKDIGKLEVEKPKGKSAPQPQPRPQSQPPATKEAIRGSAA